MSNANQRDRLRPRSSPARGEEQALDRSSELAMEQGSELSDSAAALLARVRQRRRDEQAPDDLRRRALARALAEAERPAVLAMPAPVLVPVVRPWARALSRG